MQVAGSGYRAPGAALRQLMDTDIALERTLARFIYVFANQVSFTALSNAVDPIDVRLARWLLMCHDRIGGNSLRLTHDYIAIMLGVRRASVTNALHLLEGKHLIRSNRGKVTVRDRQQLELFAGKSYGGPEREYRSIMTTSNYDRGRSDLPEDIMGNPSKSSSVVQPSNHK